MICLPRTFVDVGEIQRYVPAKARAARNKTLIADDNVDAAESLGVLLALSDHDVHVTHSRREAFDAAKEMRPDVCIFDIAMPHLNGNELADGGREAWRKAIKLMALTG